ncbi:MAG: Gfo/Idh/MocA family oxidoreductase [Bacillota bacterium]
MKLLSIGPPSLDSSGYGEMQRRILLALEDLGWTITLRPFPSMNEHIEDTINRPRLKKMEERPLPPPGSPLLFFAPAPMFQPNPNYYNVGFTMTEVDRINREWVDKCNRMNEVWVPSRFNYDIFLSHGVRPEKLRIMHLGIDTRHFKPSRRDEGKPRFTFLSCFELIPRKSCDILMEAFCEEFQSHEPVELVIKSFENGGRYDPEGKALAKIMQSITGKFPDHPPIILKKHILPYSELPTLYKDADCFISTSRGEGWNLPLMEAMSCGVPAIALNWSGQTEFLTPLNSYLLDVPFLEEISEPWCPGCQWAAVDKNSLRRAMRTAFDQPLATREKGNKSRLDIRKKFSVKTIAEQITLRLKKKVAVLGFGSWGKNIVRVILSLPSTDVVICDPALESHPYPGDSRVSLGTYREILKDPLLKHIFIVTPASTHFSLAREALEAGKNVFVEKPFTMSSAQAEELEKMARSKKLTIMAGHIMQYHPAVHHLKEEIDKGSLGKIVYFRTNRTSLGSVRHDAGVLWDLAVHDVDMVCFLTGQLPHSVSAWNKAFLEHSLGDTINIQMSFPSGTVAHIFASWLDPLKKRELVVVGNKKMALFDDTSSSQKLALIDRGVECVGAATYGNYGEFHFYYRFGDIHYPYIYMQEPLRNEIAHFLECAENRTQPRTGAGNAVAVTRIMEAADLSSQKGGEAVLLDWQQKEVTP